MKIWCDFIKGDYKGVRIENSSQQWVNDRYTSRQNSWNNISLNLFHYIFLLGYCEFVMMKQAYMAIVDEEITLRLIYSAQFCVIYKIIINLNIYYNVIKTNWRRNMQDF